MEWILLGLIITLKWCNKYNKYIWMRVVIICVKPLSEHVDMLLRIVIEKYKWKEIL